MNNDTQSCWKFPFIWMCIWCPDMYDPVCLTILLWQQTTISAILYWNYSWCLSSSPPWRVGSVVECNVQEFSWKKDLVLIPIFIADQDSHLFFFFFKTPSFCWSGDHLSFYFCFSIASSYVLSFIPPYISLPSFPLYDDLIWNACASLFKFQFLPFILSWLPVQAIADVKTSDLPKK